MAAVIGTTANLTSGLRELSQVTNTYAGYLESAGSAYNLVLPWQADKLEWFNYTKYATGGNNAQGVWFRDFPNAAALIISTAPATVLETVNGVTINNSTGGFTDQHRVISGISAGVVTTTTDHGLVDQDRVIITKVIGTVAAEVNNKEFVVDVLSSNTFKLYDVYGNAFVQVGTWTSSGQVTREGPDYDIQNLPITYRLTLGSAVMGANGDAIYFVASKFNAYFNLGDVA